MDEIDQVIHIDWELVSLHKQCMNRLMSDRGVYPGQPPLLFTLGRMGACNQADLAKALHISPATIAVSLKRMEKSGFVKRVPDPGDLRSNRIELTERGRRAAARADHAIRRVNQQMYRDFTPEEFSQIVHFYQRMQQNLIRLKQELYGQEEPTCAN